MARPAPGNGQDHVEAGLVAGKRRATRQKCRGRPRDAPALVPGQRFGRRSPIGAGLHFDEGDDAAPAGDDVDLAQAALQVARQDAIPGQAESQDGQALGAPTPEPCLAPLGLPPALSGSLLPRLLPLWAPPFLPFRALLADFSIKAK